MTGKFIVIEGLDGAGTTTQSRMLADSLRARGQAALTTFEPSDGPIGSMIRQMLSMRIAIPRPGAPAEPMTRETLALLFAADRLDHVAARVEPAIEQGVHVVSDRYYHSSIAYQGDRDEDGTDDFAWVLSLNSRARVPDITFMLEASAELCMERMDARGGERDLYENLAKLERLERRYRETIDLLQERGQQIVRIDASMSIDAVQAAILEALLPLIEG